MGKLRKFHWFSSSNRALRWGFTALGGLLIFSAGIVVGRVSADGNANRVGVIDAVLAILSTTTSTPTITPTVTLTATMTPTVTPSPTSTYTSSPTITWTPTHSPTPTITPSPSSTTTPSPTASATRSANCDPSYPTVCIPSPPPDLDCKDIPYRKFQVLPPDPHNFDGDGNGIGCERP